MRPTRNNHAFAFLESALCGEFCRRRLRLNHPPTIANTIPPAKNVTPVMTAASSNHTQLFRMVRLKLAELSCTHPMAVAHTAPPAKSVTPAMNIAVSNRVIIQLLRMARLNR
jgi:hypothetical protein